MHFNGLHTDLVPAESQAAQSGINARQMIRLAPTGLFSDQDIADELTFSGMRPASQHRMLLAIPYLASASERNQLRSAVESAYVNGLLDDAGLLDNLDAAEQNTDRDNLSLQRVKWQLLISETKKLEGEYAAMFKGGLVDDFGYRALMSGLGLTPGYLAILEGVVEAAANVTLNRKNLADQLRTTRQTAAAERKAALKSYADGASDIAVLTAALLATGLTPAQAAAQASLAALQSAGSLRWIYGLQLSPAEATLLRQRVSALNDQAKRMQITIPAYTAALQALNIPPRYVNALTAAAASMISPKTAAIIVPVATS
jgi:hypothetical protein